MLRTTDLLQLVATSGDTYRGFVGVWMRGVRPEDEVQQGGQHDKWSKA